MTMSSTWQLQFQPHFICQHFLRQGKNNVSKRSNAKKLCLRKYSYTLVQLNIGLVPRECVYAAAVVIIARVINLG